MLTKLLRFGKDGKNNKISENLFVPHVVAWEFGLLVIVFCQFMCDLSWGCARQDVCKYEDKRSFLHFLYFLGEYDFWYELRILLLVVSEWVIYMRLYRRARKNPKHRGEIVYYSVVTLLHIGACLHANLLPIPEDAALASIRGGYCHAANRTVLPSVLYCIVYFWHLYRLRKEKNKMGESTRS